MEGVAQQETRLMISLSEDEITAMDAATIGDTWSREVFAYDQQGRQIQRIIVVVTKV